MPIYLCDAFAGLAACDAGEVDLVLSDLPSGETEAEFDRAPNLAALFDATWRALKPDGVAVFMASSLRFAAACMAAGGKTYRYDLIWEKSRPSGHLNAKRMPMRGHEFALIFSRARGHFAPQMRETGIAIKTTRGAYPSENYNGFKQVENTRKGATDRYPSTVLRFDSVPQSGSVRIHPQQKPEDLLRWLVRSYSRPGELVVDPFAGSGSTIKAAEAEGRQGVGFDSSPRFASVPL